MIAVNVKNIRQIIAKTCLESGRKDDAVLLVGVSKTFGPEKVAEAVAAGLYDLGENYIQELREKRDVLRDERIRWHFIGHLQTNKVKYLAEWISMIHSVDSEALAKEIDLRAKKAGRKINVLVEVNTSHEETKFGVDPDRAIELLKRISVFQNIMIAGLMTIGRFDSDPEASRPCFRRLRQIFDEANEMGFLREPMSHLSMGMSHDFTVAIQEGATMVRIGTAIFGTRNTQH
jgi:PLP dependent protein